MNLKDILKLARSAGWTARSLSFALKWPADEAERFLATGSATPDRLDQWERWARHKVGMAAVGGDYFDPPTQIQPMSMGVMPQATVVHTITREPNTTNPAEDARRQRRYLKDKVA
ncbi:hypothetical protein ACVDG8_002420 [Mesorhizobium sp. ORM8.1]